MESITVVLFCLLGIAYGSVIAYLHKKQHTGIAKIIALFIYSLLIAYVLFSEASLVFLLIVLVLLVALDFNVWFKRKKKLKVDQRPK